MIDSFFYPVILAGIIAGGSTGLLGVYVVGMRIPFIGTCIAHSAMAGAVFGALLGLNPTACAIILSVLSALGLGFIKSDKLHLETNIGLAIIFSLMMGLTFLGIGLMQDSRTDILGLLWGSLLIVDMAMVRNITIITAVVMAFIFLCSKELKAILFSRAISAAAGMGHKIVYIIFLMACSALIAINLPAVGGLLIFSLLTNPAAAAYQISKGFKCVIALSAAFGIISAVGGFFISFWLNLPTGACIVILSTVIFAICALIRKIFILNS